MASSKKFVIVWANGVFFGSRPYEGKAIFLDFCATFLIPENIVQKKWSQTLTLFHLLFHLIFSTNNKTRSRLVLRLVENNHTFFTTDIGR